MRTYIYNLVTNQRVYFSSFNFTRFPGFVCRLKCLFKRVGVKNSLSDTLLNFNFQLRLSAPTHQMFSHYSTDPPETLRTFVKKITPEGNSHTFMHSTYILSVIWNSLCKPYRRLYMVLVQILNINSEFLRPLRLVKPSTLQLIGSVALL